MGDLISYLLPPNYPTAYPSLGTQHRNVAPFLGLVLMMACVHLLACGGTEPMETTLKLSLPDRHGVVTSRQVTVIALPYGPEEGFAEDSVEVTKNDDGSFQIVGPASLIAADPQRVTQIKTRDQTNGETAFLCWTQMALFPGAWFAYHSPGESESKESYTNMLFRQASIDTNRLEVRLTPPENSGANPTTWEEPGMRDVSFEFLVLSVPGTTWESFEGGAPPPGMVVVN